MAVGAEEASHEEERLGASEILPHRALSGVDLLGADPEEGWYLGYLDLFRASSVPIRRHVKIQAEAMEFDSAY
jgi:hypothetical protein